MKNQRQPEMCSNCGAVVKFVSSDYVFAESGLKNVVLAGIPVAACRICGNQDVEIEALEEVLRRIAMEVIAQPHRLSGHEIRFLRKHCGLTQASFAALLHAHVTTVSKWENGGDIPGEQSDRLIRTVALAMGEGLQGKLTEVVRGFPAIKKTLRRSKIVIGAIGGPVAA
jgi:putative zinc finger/helix-turn-helix YgiT family protein